ncbi:MAG: type II secretion system protein GspG [Candidatus Sumerlaeaceae bacterium]|nr:type II secretion system protein GspG [Candidatus Sumerlaeaceae bacterium]
MRKPISFRGFTLIELLIVVAIIAILAAIAVPNFLEAQTRAKVSRTKADMRSIATALESYRVDGNKYPPAADYPNAGLTPSNTAGNFPFHSRVPSWISTPIAYITSLGQDVFLPKTNPPPLAPNVYGEGTGYRYTYFNYYEFLEANVASPSLVTNYGARIEMTGGWLFYSFGPDQAGNFDTAVPSLLGVNRVYTRYDPTNGTVSVGNIIRTARSSEGSIPYNPVITTATNGQN